MAKVTLTLTSWQASTVTAALVTDASKAARDKRYVTAMYALRTLLVIEKQLGEDDAAASTANWLHSVEELVRVTEQEEN